MEIYVLNRPNFLGSEVGLVLKTITVPASATGAVTENGRKIVKAGSIFATPYAGLLFNDVDITDGDRIGSLMVRGSYIPAAAAAKAEDFAKQGLYAIVEGAVVRPDFGTVEV